MVAKGAVSCLARMIADQVMAVAIMVVDRVILDLVTYINWKTGSNWSVNSYAVFGFSDGSPDAGIGVQLIYRQ